MSAATVTFRIVAAEMRPQLRPQLCQVIHWEMDGWMREFMVATHGLAGALVAGTLTEEQLAAYPQVNDLPKVLADRCDLFESADDGGWRTAIGGEAISVAVGSLRAIPAADISLNTEHPGGVWAFDPDNLAERNLTIGQIKTFMRGLTLTEAARLIRDSSTAR